MFENQPSQPVNILDFFNSTKTVIEPDRVQLTDGTVLYFNQNLKITHKQKKQLSSLMYIGTGMKLAGSDMSFEFPEVFLENIEKQKETLLAIYWNTEEYWRTGGSQGNYWHSRPAEMLEADVVEHMFEQVQDRVDPLKTKEMKEKAKNQVNESR